MTAVAGQRWRLSQIASRFGFELQGDDAEVVGVSSLSPGEPGCISFAQSQGYAEAIAQTRSVAVIVSRDLDVPASCCVLRADHAQLGFAQVAALFAADDRPTPGVDASAVVDAQACLGEGVRIGPQCYVARGAQIGDACSIAAGCVIGADAQLGAHCNIGARVVIGERVQIGQRALILPGAVIGSRGFGNVHDGQRWHAMPQMGSVVLGDDVEIGANTTIDRGALGDTVIGDNARIDNLCQIAHNVHIGPRTALAAGVGIAGSSRIGSDCMLGGQVGVNGHIEICDRVIVNGGSNVLQSISQPGQYGSGVPLMPVMAWRRFMALVGKLEKRLKKLERGRNRE